TSAGIAAMGTAQDVASDVRFVRHETSMMQPMSQQPSGSAERRVALRIKEQPLAQALQTIAAAADMRVSFSSEVTRIQQPVTLIADTLVAIDAMAAVLTP